MNLTEFPQLIYNLKYKPTWTIQAQVGIDEYLIFMTMLVQNAKDPDQQSPLFTHMRISYKDVHRMSKHEVLMRIRNEIIKMETHEVNEFLKYKGAHVVDPHPEKTYMPLKPKAWYRKFYQR